VALLIAVLGLVALAGLILAGIGGKINALWGIGFDWSLKSLFGYAFYPFTLLIGIPVADAGTISRIIGERIIVTELAAYQDLAALLRQNALTDPRSAVLCSYALCGFAHVASMAIFIGGIAAIAPDTTRQLSRVGLRALAAATLACLMTASIAGVFYMSGSLLFG
jgi:CNT family concentrative nucleoside transporter